MNKVIFSNKGLMDIRAITTFGLSAKVNNNPIGFFGTGLKYAIAIMVRNDVKFEIQIGDEKYNFSKSALNMRGKDFELVTMNGAELSFGTNLGTKWDLWQAFRELYCNAMDEQGDVYFGEPFADPKDHTQIIIDDERFVELFKKRHEIVLDKKRLPIFVSPEIEVYSGESKSAYYRGVRVLDLPNPTLYTYNILENTELTEDRIVKNQGFFLNSIPMYLRKLNDKNVIFDILTASNTHRESAFDYHIFDIYYGSASDEFKEVMENLYKNNHEHYNLSAKMVFMKNVNANSFRNKEPYQMTEIEAKMLEKAMAHVALAFPEVKNYSTLVVKDLGQNTMALADSKTNTIVISQRCFTQGTKYLVSTIIEEYFHLWTGYGDQTRALQTYLFDQITSLVERYVVKEPM